MSILMPKKVKHRKWHTSRKQRVGLESRGTKIAYGSYGLKTVEAYRITSRQIEAARRAILRYLKKGGKLWIRVFPDRPVTKKGDETPMGGGKGGVDHYVFVAKPGRIVFELDGLKEDLAREALKKAGDKLPMKTKFVKKI